MISPKPLSNGVNKTYDANQGYDSPEKWPFPILYSNLHTKNDTSVKLNKRVLVSWKSPQTRDSQTVVGLSLFVFGSKSLINWLIFSSYHTSNIYIYIYG